MNSLFLASLPLVGVVVGATLQFWLTRSAERGKRLEHQRSEAYADYLRAVAAAAHLRSDEDLRDAHRNAADAKARLAVYASGSVLNALARFEKAGAVLNNSQGSAAFIALVSEMRPDREQVPQADLELVLLGAVRDGAGAQHSPAETVASRA